MAKYVKKTNPKNKGGRPKETIDFAQFEGFCGVQCTKLEICNFFNITDKTLDRIVKEHYKMGFSDIYEQKRGRGKISLRRTQWKLAETSVAMAIFLGKNYLGQSDKQEIDTNGKVKITVVNNLEN